MRAIRIESLDGPQAVVAADVPEPVPSPGQLLVDVEATCVVFPDLLQTRGLYQLKPELPFVPGSTVAGTVRTAPAGSGFAPGDRVTALCVLGGWAEAVAVDPATTFRLPDTLSFAEGAATPFNYLTMQFGLVRRGRLQSGETVLVHGAAGGIGTASIQLAAALGARVIAVVSSTHKGEVARAAGAHDVVAVEGFRDTVGQLTAGRGVDVVVDPVGGDRFTDSLRCLAPEGRLLVIGFTAGDIPTVRVNRLLLNNIDVVGVGWGAFWTPRAGYLHEQWDDLLPMLSDGRLRPTVGRTYPLEQAAEALVAMDTRQATGTLVLSVGVAATPDGTAAGGTMHPDQAP